MSIKEKVLVKENNVRSLLEQLRNKLNSQRMEFNKSPQTWTYITSLSHTEKCLVSLLEYLDSTPKEKLPE